MLSLKELAAKKKPLTSENSCIFFLLFFGSHYRVATYYILNLDVHLGTLKRHCQVLVGIIFLCKAYPIAYFIKETKPFTHLWTTLSLVKSIFCNIVTRGGGCGGLHTRYFH
ncbi:hypothetical protein PanWU01x14_081050 [Parasponia andersonii]|uniref:Uncharacterized protein n=1 Tax=Parasponia andersonii TaxID=3476 RepID=A0A2P5DAW4_PARAD|nr:hypothetical protein PanWU01x14_081050 [Parasponia andersonii]